MRRPDAAEDVEARGRWDDDDADGITRVGVRVDVRDDDRGWIGLVARVCAGWMGGNQGRGEGGLHWPQPFSSSCRSLEATASSAVIDQVISSCPSTSASGSLGVVSEHGRETGMKERC